jgi:hypothetical protein
VDSLQAAEKLAARNVPFLISWKEAGRHQVAKTLEQPRVVARFQEISHLAKGFLASTPWLVPFFRAAGLSLGGFVPTPYPVEFAEWDFQIAAEKRLGIFLGTREFCVPSRNHAAAIFFAADLAHRLGIHVTCLNAEGRYGRTLLQRIDAGRKVIRIVEGVLPYGDYLKLMAQHRIVLQFDRSGVPGQVAGDAMLCGIPCLGGDGAVDDILSHSAANRNDTESWLEYAHQLLTNFSLYLKTTEDLRRRAFDVLSFRSGAQALRRLIEGLSSK